MYVDEEMPEGLYVYLEVGDIGVRMSLETVQKIFDPFFTTKFTGRGLAAVLGIVRGHRGGIRVMIRAGEGTTPSILFPVEEQPDTREATRSVGQVRSVRVPSISEDASILLFDDEPMSRDVTAAMLEHLGHSVVLAANGMEALELFQPIQRSVSLVLLDLTMPVMDGIGTWSEIQTINPDVPEMFMSGYSEMEVCGAFMVVRSLGLFKSLFVSGSLLRR